MANLRTRMSLSPALMLLGASILSAQVTYPNVKFAGRLQVQFYALDNSDYQATGRVTSNFFLRRARIQVSGNISENVSLMIQPDFAGGRTISNNRGGVRVRDAYIDVRLTKAEAKTSFTVRMGQEKRPYSRWELTSSNNLVSIERGAGQGLLQVATNDLFGGAGFLSHDVGAAFLVNHKLGDARAFTFQAGVYNGQGESANDVNGKKSFGVRGTVDVTQKLSVGGSFFSHDAIQGTDSSFTNQAFGVDAAWNKPGEQGLYVLAEYLDGEANNVTKDPMRGISILGAYNIRMKSPTAWLYAIEPMARFDQADPNTDVNDNASTLFTAGFGLYFSSRAQFRVAYEHQSFQANGATSINGVRTAMTVNF